MQNIFDDRATEFIDLPRMFYDPVIRSNILSNTNNFEVPTVFYNLEKPIHSRIFNFNKFVFKLDVDRFLQDKNILPWNDVDSEFIIQHHKYILIGNLKIMRENKLMKLLTKGPNQI